MAPRVGQGVGDGRVLDAARLHGGAHGARGEPRAAGRAGPRRSSGSSDGRSAAVTDLSRLGERTITIDCDVLQADAGTRTASITGGYLALALALRGAVGLGRSPVTCSVDRVAAVSVGIVDGAPLLDLCYEEDAGADVDFNVVMTGDGRPRRGPGDRRG